MKKLPFLVAFIATFPLVLLQAKAVSSQSYDALPITRGNVSISSPSGEGGEKILKILTTVKRLRIAFPLVLLQAKAVRLIALGSMGTLRSFH